MKYSLFKKVLSKTTLVCAAIVPTSYTYTLTPTQSHLIGRSLEMQHTNTYQSNKVLEDFIYFNLMEIISKNELEFDSRIRMSIISDPQYNAFATEGNFIFIYTGLLQGVPDITNILSIMCHELGHSYKHHVQQAINFHKGGSNSTLALLGLIPLIATAPHAAILLSTATIEQDLYNKQQFSRKHEYEADEFSLQLMTGAGFAPELCINSISSLDIIDPELTKSFNHNYTRFSSHPFTSQRVEHLRSMSQDIPSDTKFIDPTTLQQDYYRVFAVNFTENFWPTDSTSQQLMREVVTHKLDINYWEQLWQTQRSIAAFFNLFYLYQSDDSFYEKQQALLDEVKGDNVLKKVPSIESAFIEKDQRTMENRAFIRKYQQFLFSDSTDTNPKILSLLATSYRDEGNEAYSRIALAKMYLLSGNYKAGLRLMHDNKKLLESPIGFEVHQKLKYMEESIQQFM